MVCLVRMDKLNRNWGTFVATYPITHLVLSTVLILLFGVPLRNLHIELDIRASFSPSNSRASYENRVYREFFNLTVSPQRSFVLFSAKDHGSVLRQKHLNEVLKLDERFSSFLHEVDPTTGLRSCDPLCNLNKPFHMISKHLLELDINGSTSKDLVLDYPISKLKTIDLDLFVGMNLIGPQVSDTIFPQNNSKIVSVKTIILWYFSRADTPRMKKRLRETTLELFKLGQKGEYLENVRFEIFGDEVANSEMVRGAVEATILMSIGFLLLVIFVSFTVYQKMRKISRIAIPVIVFTAVFCPFLGCLAAFGLCTLLGFPIYTLMCVCPFLVQGVGVDDAFIMLQSWNQHQHIKSLKDRMALVFAHIGPSITITSLTNTIAFGIGFSTPTPQMSMFCLCTSFALLFDYILTFTFLAPILYICTPKPHVEQKEVVSLLTQTNVVVEKVESAPLKNIPSYVVWYSKFVCSWKGRVAMLIVCCILHVFSTSGLITMRSTFEPSKAFPSDSPLANSMSTVRTVFNEFFPMNIIVNRPPEISNRTDRAGFYQMVTELEELPESYGRDRTLLFLRTYEKMDWEAANLLSYVGYNLSSYEPTYDNLEFFLEKIGQPSTIKYSKKNNKTHLDSFQFSIITSNMAEWSNRAVTEEKCREILQRYPQYNATIYDGDSAVLDLLLTVKLDLSGSLAVTIVCMTLVCSIFIHNQVGVILVALTIASVCYALVGLISWWGADLDPVTMVDVLLATGFSVDYTAHIAHQYYVKKGANYVRLASSFDEMSSPMIQAAFSTILVMCPLFFVRTYAIVAFAKTVFVVVAVAILHGLFIMPVLICWVPENLNCRRQRKHRELTINGYNTKSEAEIAITPRTPILTS
ncbi:Patched-related protein 9 [Aphelenchoides besseyi]|nr:Patched-related protein 9 [Aphelenchoides besseyi]